MPETGKEPWQWGEPPHMASVCRDMIEVNLCWTAMAPPAPATVYFQMTGVDAYDDEISYAGATVTVPIADRV